MRPTEVHYLLHWKLTPNQCILKYLGPSSRWLHIHGDKDILPFVKLCMFLAPYHQGKPLQLKPSHSYLGWDKHHSSRSLHTSQSLKAVSLSSPQAPKNIMLMKSDRQQQRSTRFIRRVKLKENMTPSEANGKIM